jgi:hypothetical protein
MPNNPVQIILNDADFHAAPEPGQPPRNKDFFENADQAFAEHKATLLAAVDRVIATLKVSPYGPVAYLRVQMRQEALAKSYRPVGCLFKPDQFPCVGAEAVGTLFFRAPLIYLSGLRARIDGAEITVVTKYRLRDNEPYKAPSNARAEVGAIETLEIAPASSKRHFSAQAAMALFDDPAVVSGYHVELFEQPEPRVIADDPIGRTRLRRSLEQLLLSLGAGARSFQPSKIGTTPVLELQLTASREPALLDNRPSLFAPDGTVDEATAAPVDRDPQRHEAALSALQDHPLVRTILPPIRLQLTDGHGAGAGAVAGSAPVFIAPPASGSVYPIVGVIDSGVGPALNEWVVGRFDYLDPSDIEPGHGTGVAGLVSVAQLTNSAGTTPETDGCLIYDAALYPKGPFGAHYPRGFTDFLEELEQAVAEARNDHGVRIFNLSINAVSDVEPYRYSIYASRLDQIADTYGVIFVNSAGNLPRAGIRTPWSSKPGEVIQYFASRTSPDTLFKPAESVRSISVGALNPPGTDQLVGAPTIYTTRGPGLQVGVKPDVAAFGGVGGVAPGTATGLVSIGPDGTPRPVAGTSFAAPLVARTLAGLDTATQGGLTTEALRAMLLHHSTMPAPLTRQKMKDLARQFAGFGQPTAVANMLETDDHQITLLFQSRLSIGERKPVILRFPFEWPQSLVNTDGGCSGRARMTLVYSPPLDPAFGAEFVRVNLEARLTQRQAPRPTDTGPRYTDQIDAKYLRGSSQFTPPERALIAHGLKWWPSKQYGSNFNGHGTSPQWRLEVTSLVRAEARFPAEGVPFAVLLTLEDPDGRHDVFRQFRQQLQVSTANAQDIRTMLRIRPRG